MKKKALHYLLVFSLLVQSSCSVVAAASGSPEPNLAAIKAGTSRVVVEKELGPPVKAEKMAAGEKVQYTYKLGDEPAAGRAALYLVADILTLFLFEYIAFPMEISNSGNAHDIEVTYGANGIVRTVKQIESFSEPAYK